MVQIEMNRSHFLSICAVEKIMQYSDASFLAALHIAAENLLYATVQSTRF